MKHRCIINLLISLTCILLSCNKKEISNDAPVNPVSYRNYLIVFAESNNNDTTSDIFSVNRNGENKVRLTSYGDLPFYKQYKYRNCYDLRFSRFDSTLLLHSLSYGDTTMGTSLQSIDVVNKTLTGHASVANGDGTSSQSGGFWLLSPAKYPNESLLYSTSFSIISFTRDTRVTKVLASSPLNKNHQYRDLLISPNKNTVYYSLVKPGKIGWLSNDTIYLNKTSVTFQNVQVIKILNRQGFLYYKYGPPIIEDISENGDLIINQNGFQITDSLGNVKQSLSQYPALLHPRFIPGCKDSVAGVLNFANKTSGVFFLHVAKDAKRILYQNLGSGYINGLTVR